MLPFSYRKKFIALDLETTHLDVREGRIMEVGAVEGELFFDGEVKVNFGKSFTTLINPEIEPSEAALTLTGITKEELTTAPLWRDVKADFQKFLADAVLVGQNLNFDLAFLKNQGLDLKNPYFDTLEMAQAILPLADSHSLEYMAESFGVLEGRPHRALPDSQNTARVCAAIPNHFFAYPQKLREEILDLLRDSTIGFRELLLDLPEAGKIRDLSRPSRPRLVSARRAATLPTPGEGDKVEINLSDKTIISLPITFSDQEKLLHDLSRRKEPLMVGVSHPVHLEGLPDNSVVPNPRFALCDARLQHLSAEGELGDLARKILIKVKILRGSKRPLDLSQLRFPPEERLLLPAIVCDPGVCFIHKCSYYKLTRKNNGPRFATLAALFKLWKTWKLDFHSQKLVLFDLSAIEEDFTESMTETWNLQKIRRMLGVVYPLADKQNFSMSSRLPGEVQKIANELDLFFGVLHLIYLKRTGEFAQNVLLDDEESQSERFVKLTAPAEKLASRLADFSVYLEKQSELEDESMKTELGNLRSRLGAAEKFLREFFLERREEKIYWLKFNDSWVDLNAQPQKAAEEWKQFAEKFETATILDQSTPLKSFAYYQSRLGLQNFRTEKIPAAALQEIPVEIFSKPLPKAEYVKLLLALPARTLVVVPNEAMLSEYFAELAKNKKPDQEILAYKHSGSVFQLRAKTSRTDFLLLLTTHALKTYFPKLPPLQNLVIFRIPFEHPLARPQLLTVPREDAFASHILPRAIRFFHGILEKFVSSSSGPVRIFILDHRILTEYDRAFADYLAEFPEFRISTASER